MTPILRLASNSPRRRQILALTGWEFVVQPVDIDESPYPGEPPPAYVLRLAESKARAAGKMAQPGDLILAADTTVASDGQILGKPANVREARAMLGSLRGREHQVYTAIGVFDPHARRLETDLCTTRVWMRSYSDAEIDAYIATGDPFDKAGAYAVQHPGFRPVERMEGCYSCVVGLPLCRVVRTFQGFGWIPPHDAAAACLEYQEADRPCPVYEQIVQEEMNRVNRGGEQD